MDDARLIVSPRERPALTVVQCAESSAPTTRREKPLAAAIAFIGTDFPETDFQPAWCVASPGARLIFRGSKLSPQQPRRFFAQSSRSAGPEPAPRAGSECAVISRTLHWAILSIRRAAGAIDYTQTTCSTGAMPTQQSSAANTMDRPCSPTWQAFTPTQLRKPGNKN